MEYDTNRIYRVETTEGNVFEGRYMGKDVYGRLQFDLRPAHGTTTIAEEDIEAMSSRPVGKDTPSWRRAREIMDGS